MFCSEVMIAISSVRPSTVRPMSTRRMRSGTAAAVVLAGAGGLLLGIGIYRVAIQRVLGASHLSTLLATFAINMILVGLKNTLILATASTVLGTFIGIVLAMMGGVFVQTAVFGAMATGIGTRVFYVTLGGFDTHANQLGTHADAVRQSVARQMLVLGIHHFSAADLRAVRGAEGVVLGCTDDAGAAAPAPRRRSETSK